MISLPEIIGSSVPLRKVGAELHGPCPSCGHGKSGAAASDRFVVWQKDGQWRWWCRAEDTGGDTVAYLRVFQGVKCADAHLQIGQECTSTDCPALGKCAATRDGARVKPSDHHRKLRTPQEPAVPTGWQPAEAVAPADIWQQKAVEFIDACHQALLNRPADLQWLESRGLPLAAVLKNRLGWCAGETRKGSLGPLFKTRSAWGIPPEPAVGGNKPITFFTIHPGLVIPTFCDGRLFRIRIRTPQDYREHNPQISKYLAVKGSGKGVVLRHPAAKAFVVIESDLDDLMVDHAAGDIVCSVALTSCNVRPDAKADTVLKSAPCILCALDYEPRVNQETGKNESPGGENWLKWWRPRYPQAKRHPVPGGKDPGEFFEAGGDIRAWIIAGLPAGLRPSPSAAHPEPCAPSPGPESSPVAPSALSLQPSAAVLARGITRDGRNYLITTDPAYREEGTITFTQREMALMQQAKPDPEAAARILDAKEIFGAVISEVGQIEEWMKPEEVKVSSGCYWNK